MSSNLHSFTRRGVETAHLLLSRDSDQDDIDHVSPWAALLFLMTVLVFIALLTMISYTYGHVIPALCMIESPETNAYVPVQTLSSEPPAYSEELEDDDGVPKPNAEPEVLLVRNKPITASIRATVLHLRARAGFWSRFRGIGIFVVWGILRNILIAALSLGSHSPFAISLAAILAEVALAHIHLTWIHIVISEPSDKRWYQRIPSLRGNWIKIAPAVLLWSVVTQLVHILPMLMTGSWGTLKHMQDPDFQPGKKHIYFTAGQYTMIVVLTLMFYVLLQIPAAVTMIRVAASMLPEEDETIVPFDRTFGGKVTPTIIGGQGKIGLVEAWRSFPWTSRKRLLVLCAKVAAIVFAVWMLFAFIMVTEAHLMFGEHGLRKIMRAIHGVRGPH